MDNPGRDGRRRLRRLLARLAGDLGGGTLTLTAVVFPAVAGFSGLALDGANWYAQRRATQTMADAAAIAGAYPMLANEGQQAIDEAALLEAERNGYEALPGNRVVATPSSTPPSGPIVPLVEARVERRTRLYFAGLFLPGDSITISANAVSGARALGPQCVIALNKTKARAVHVTGSTVADIGCGVAANSNDPDEAILIGGNALLRANPAQAVGRVTVSGSGQLNSQLPPLSFSPEAPDPLAGLPHPPAGAPCPSGGGGGSKTVITNAGDLPTPGVNGVRTFCGNVQFNGTFTLPPGQYVFKNGDFDLGSKANVTGTGVTMMFTGDDPATQTGNVSNLSGGALNLTAPMNEGDPFKGVAFYQDRRTQNCPPQKNKFNGNLDMSINGVIYFPACEIEFVGGAENPDNCLQVISDTVTFTGNSFIRNNPAVCQNLGLTGPGFIQQQVVLVR